MGHETAVVAFVVVEPYKAPGAIEAYRHLSRRYHVRDAAEQFAAMAQKAGHPKCYVSEIWGSADAIPKGTKR